MRETGYPIGRILAIHQVQARLRSPNSILVALLREAVLLSHHERLREELHDRNGRLANEHVAFPIYPTEPRRVHPYDLGVRDVRRNERGRHAEVVLPHFDVCSLVVQMAGDPTVVKELIGRCNDETETHLRSLVTRPRS